MFSDSTHSSKGFRDPDSARSLDIAVLLPTPFKFVRIELSLYALTVSIQPPDTPVVITKALGRELRFSKYHYKAVVGRSCKRPRTIIS
jgi:hypothetical protein